MNFLAPIEREQVRRGGPAPDRECLCKLSGYSARRSSVGACRIPPPSLSWARCRLGNADARQRDSSRGVAAGPRQDTRSRPARLYPSHRQRSRRSARYGIQGRIRRRHRPLQHLRGYKRTELLRMFSCAASIRVVKRACARIRLRSRVLVAEILIAEISHRRNSWTNRSKGRHRERNQDRESKQSRPHDRAAADAVQWRTPR